MRSVHALGWHRLYAHELDAPSGTDAVDPGVRRDDGDGARCHRLVAARAVAIPLRWDEIARLGSAGSVDLRRH